MTPTPSADHNPIPRILVVDDMPDNLFLMNGLLEDRFVVVQAASGKDALEIVMSANPPDLVLLDIMMPDMDGYEVLRRIRQHMPTANIPVIFLTALASQQDEKLGMELGALDYLTKPVDPELVLRRVQTHMKATAQARRIEGLSEKLSRHLSAQRWEHLFHGSDLESIRFSQKFQTVLYAEAEDIAGWSERDRDAFTAEVDWLATRYSGTVDRYAHGASVVFFDKAGSCVRMAMDLQRSTTEFQLRVGIHTGLCEIGTFRSESENGCTLIGLETGLAAKVAASAANGSISLSPETYALVKDDIHSGDTACLLTEEFNDRDLAQVLLTPTPTKGGQAMSTFAGLGNF